MASKKRKIGECVYCGSVERLTEDHVPPKSWFAPRTRPYLVTVPSCKRCNDSFSLDDEYFRLMAAMKDDAGEHPDAKAAMEANLSALRHPRKERLRAATLRNIVSKERYSTSGLYLGRAAAYDVDLARMCRTVARIVRALYWLEFKRRLPATAQVDVRAFSGFELSDIKAAIAVYRIVVTALGGKTAETPGGGFRYAVTRANDRHDASVWFVSVYERVAFLAFTGLPVTKLAA